MKKINHLRYAATLCCFTSMMCSSVFAKQIGLEFLGDSDINEPFLIQVTYIPTTPGADAVDAPAFDLASGGQNTLALDVDDHQEVQCTISRRRVVDGVPRELSNSFSLSPDSLRLRIDGSGNVKVFSSSNPESKSSDSPSPIAVHKASGEEKLEGKSS